MSVRTSLKGETSVPLDNALVKLHEKVSLSPLLQAGRNTIIGYDPGPINGTFCLFIVGREGLAREHGLCVPMKVNLFADADCKIDTTVQACRDRLVQWIRANRWVVSQACMAVIERQLIAKRDGAGRLDFANQKNNTLATTLEGKWEDTSVNSAGDTLPIAPISKESFHFAYDEIFPVPPDGVNAHDFNKESVLEYAERKDLLMAPFERQMVEADFSRNYYQQMSSGRTRPESVKRDADDYYDSAIFAMGAYEHAFPPDCADRPAVICYRKTNKCAKTLELYVCPRMAMQPGTEYELCSDGLRLMLIFCRADHPLLLWIEALFAHAFSEGAVLQIKNKNRLRPSLLRPLHSQVLPHVLTSKELCIPVDLTNEQLN